MGFPKRLLGEGETLVLELRPHVKRLFGPALLLVLVAPVATFAVAVVPAGGMQLWVRWAIVLAALLVLLRWSIWPFLVWWNTVYVVTDRRLVMRQGVISRRGHDMPLTRLNDVTFSHGLVDRMLGCGDLIVESAGERGQVVLDDIPRVEQVQRTLYRLSDALRDGYAGPIGRDGGGVDGDGGLLDDPGRDPRRDPRRDLSGDAGGDPGGDQGGGASGDRQRRSRWGRRR